MYIHKHYTIYAGAHAWTAVRVHLHTDPCTLQPTLIHRATCGFQAWEPAPAFPQRAQ